ncbi:uncharacterized protein LOC133186837 isoform X2 [Saccostrea echinata]|uniref:uncharacterized protein LOC133186837 isoform X2 n=1 Tax=Saccostrea echinata TaxID=191078 RepID=UPI002A8271C5|nr:uncharacterized protein LOC133186837 isoform X2 [Saccostrea echinata]
MERNHLFRCRIFTEGILLVYLTLLCFNELLRNLHIAAAPTQRHTKLFLLNDSMEVEIQTPWDDREREFESPEVTLGRNQLEEIKNELPVTSKEVKESHSNAIQERSAPDKCKFLKKIGDMSLKGAPTFSLAILPKNVVIIIQSYPKNESLRYLCANGTLSADPANFSSAESSCSLRNITKVNLDYFSNISISDPCWIQSETIDREALLFYNYEMSTEEGSCYKINREEKTTTAATDLFLRKTIRFTSFQNFSVQIKPCCDVSSTADSTTVDPGTTPKDNSKAGNAIKILLIFIGAIFAVLCLFFLCCKFCCTPKRRPSYKVEYADPSDVIASSSGAEYSTPYDTCKARNKVVKVTAKAKGAGKNKVSLRKKLSQRFSSSRPRGRRRDNDSGFSDLLESDVSKVSGKEDQMESKEAQYMEIPLTNLNVTKSLSNPSYTLVDGKPNGRGDNDKKESGVRFTLPMSGLKEKQKLCSTSQRQENADAPYESLPDKYKSNEACKMSTEETNLTENPYAVPDCDKKSPTPSKPPETDKSRDSPYSEIKHVFSIEGDTKVKRFIKAMGEGENPYM